MWLATRNVADRHTDGQMDGQTLCDNKGLACASRANKSYARRAPTQNVSTIRNGPRPETTRRDLLGRDQDETQTTSLTGSRIGIIKTRNLS